MLNEGSLIIALEGHHAVFQAERILLEKGCGVRLVPAPFELSSNCGLALQVVSWPDDLAMDPIEERVRLLRQVLEERGLIWEGHVIGRAT